MSYRDRLVNWVAPPLPEPKYTGPPMATDQPYWWAEFRQLQRDHRELLVALVELFGNEQPRQFVHADVRCQKGPVPHVLTRDCSPFPPYNEK